MTSEEWGDLPELGARQNMNGYWSIKGNTRIWVNLPKKDRQRPVRSWPRKMGKHSSKGRFNTPNTLDKLVEEKE